MHNEICKESSKINSSLEPHSFSSTFNLLRNPPLGVGGGVDGPGLGV